MKATYGRLNEKGELMLSDGRIINSEKGRIANPTPELLARYGYKRVIEEEPPEGVVTEQQIAELDDAIKISYVAVRGG